MRVAALLKEEGGAQPLQWSIPLPVPCCPDQDRVCLMLWGPPSWTPRAASSCWEAPLLPTRSWGRSPRRTPTRQCLWSWCTVCCRTTGSWPGAGWSPSPSPGRALKPRSADDSGINEMPKAAAPTAERASDPDYLAAPAVRFAASGRRYPAGACGFFASCTGCTL